MEGKERGTKVHKAKRWCGRKAHTPTCWMMVESGTHHIFLYYQKLTLWTMTLNKPNLNERQMWTVDLSGLGNRLPGLRTMSCTKEAA